MNAWLPILSSGVAGGGTPAIEYTDTGSDTTDTSTYTFTSRAIGTAAADRKVIVAIYARTSVGTTLAVSGVTVAGVTATLVPNTANTGVDTGVSSYTGIWIADVPTGTTGTVVVTTNIGALRCAVAVYKATGITGSPSDFAVYYSSPSGTTAVSLNADVTASCVVVAVSGWAATFASAWVGVSKDVDVNLETSNFSAAHFTPSGTETPRTITSTPAGNSGNRIGSLAVFS